MRERLQKILARAGLGSRRRAEDLIRQGRVTVDGQPARLGQTVDPRTEDVRLDGRPLGPAQARATYVFHKPKNVITTLSDPQQRPCLGDYLNRLPLRLFPVGRLDNDATGLLILTNDGQLAQRLIHPRYGVDKTYRVRVRGRADEATLAALAQGVLIGERPSAPAGVKLLKSWPGGALLSLTIHEGRHHQIKRMCSQVGLKVEELTRVRVGPLKLGGLKVGQMRPLKPSELKRLKQAAGGSPPRSAVAKLDKDPGPGLS